ncbi:glycoside hydrolase family 128 protein [Sphaerobolus stellatus SS14]|nr:glycoside hydrolase family 128 protein [Sphaerobolus stellatus SS14]
MLPYRVIYAVHSGYNWQSTTSATTEQFGVKWCPMLWGGSASDVSDFQSGVLNSDTPVDCALGFNEPELDPSAGQAALDPQTAANLWVQNLFPLKAKKGTLLGSPAVTSDQTQAMAWLDAFFAACSGPTGDAHCGADFMALHFYDITTSGFQSFLTAMHDRYGLPVVVTEFGDHSFNGAAQPGQGDVFNFAGTMTSWFQSTSWIAGYAPFGAMLNVPDIGTVNQLMNNDNTPNSLAFTYYN